MATVDVPWDWFVLKMKAYKYTVKVKKFQLPTAYRFSTAEGGTSLCADPPSSACLGLNSASLLVLRRRRLYVDFLMVFSLF